MDFGFLFWVILVGLVIASLQDLKRREVDNWLNYVILFFGVSYVLFDLIGEKNYTGVLHLGILLLLFYGLMHLFYYGRVFAGGDAKLLFALSPLFLSSALRVSLLNSGIFILFLLVAGSIYGMVYSLVLYFMNFKKVNIVFAKNLRKRGRIFWVGVFVAFLILILLSVVFSSGTFVFAGLFLFVLLFFYLFAKSLEKVVMVREVCGKDLREGDWLKDTVVVGKKKVEPCWDGLTKKDLKLLHRKKKVLIKEGIPFVPAFLIALIFYPLFREFALESFFGIFKAFLV